MAITKIITLIPSATEIISFLGLDSQLVGVSHECDFPEKVKSLKKLTKTDIKTNVSSYNIHLQIEKILENSLSVYKVDENSLKYLNPDVIITQDQCNVCAVDLSQVKKVTSSYLNKEVDIISLQPKSFKDIFENIEYVAKKLNVFNALNKNKINKLLNRISVIRQKKKSFKNVICIEWCNPLMAAGNWIPDMVKIAGGNEPFGINNNNSHWIDFKSVRDFNPEVIIFMPCGYDLLQTQRDVCSLFENNVNWKNLSAYKNKKLYLVDGNQYFNRPGPRIVDSLEILAEIFNPNIFNYGYKGKGWINYFD
ncbi:ABC transporter substrate-binding protein [Alphaproteobacteria bacterium]|nr:ABC transporter substrate-binding protein [Alphaproteobacteria bacterium]